MSSGGPRRDLSWGQHAPHDRGIELIFPFGEITRLIFDPQDEHRQHSFLIKAFLGDTDRQHSFQSMLAVCGLVAVLANIPREDPHLVIVEWQTVMRIGQQAEVLWNLL